MTGRNGRLRYWVPWWYARGDDDVWATKGWPEEEKHGLPQPSGFTKQNLFINVFNQDIEMLYPQEKLFSKLFLSQQRYRGV